MSDINEKFLQAEESAQKLLHALSELKNETVSYKTSTKELEVVRRDLIGFVENSRMIVKDTHEVVSLLKRIGGPELHAAIDSISKTLQDQIDKNTKRFGQLRNLVYFCLGFSLLTLLGIITLLIQ